MDKCGRRGDDIEMKAICILLIILSGCAYPSKKSPYSVQVAEKGKAVIYLYRTSTAVDSLNPDVPRFYINGDKLGRLTVGGYYRAEVTPGEVFVTKKGSLFGIPFFWKEGEVKFTALENHTYFVKFSIESIMRIQEFKLVTNTVGEQEIKETMLLVN